MSLCSEQGKALCAEMDRANEEMKRYCGGEPEIALDCWYDADKFACLVDNCQSNFPPHYSFHWQCDETGLEVVYAIGDLHELVLDGRLPRFMVAKP